jgi:dihydrofolate reductase
MIIAIMAVDRSGGIGLDGKLPWPRNNEDMKWFVESTQGHNLVIGRSTWDRMPKPLEGRTVYVASRRLNYAPWATVLKGDLENEVVKLGHREPEKHVFVAGGREIYQVLRPVCDQVWVTHINGLYRADTRLKMSEFLTGFRIASAIPRETCTICLYQRV